MSEYLPEVVLRIPDSSWPPAADGMPVGTGRVGQFKVERELVASMLPGQVRAQTGFSIGTASVTLAQPDGQPGTPWGRGDRKVTPGQAVELVAIDESSGEETSLGSWQIDDASGALSSLELPLTLIESQYRGRTTKQRLPSAYVSVDPAWIIDALARQAGFYSTPQAGAFSEPMCGGSASLHCTATGWSEVTGVPGAATLSSWWLLRSDDSEATDFYLTANTAGTIQFGTLGLGEYEIRAGGVVAFRLGTSGTWTTTTYMPGLNPDWPLRTQLHVNHNGTGYRIRARSAGTNAAWGPWSAVLTAGLYGSWSLNLQSISAGGGISGVNMSDEDDPGVWAAPTARVPLLGATVAAPWVPADSDVWMALRQVCDSFGAAGWVSDSRVLTVATRQTLAGTGGSFRVLDVDLDVDDIKWSIAAEDYADRLEVTWHPVSWTYTADQPYTDVWSASSKIMVPAGRSLTLSADLGRLARDFASWVSTEEPWADPVWYSTWSANTSDDGSGTPLSSLSVGVSTEVVSASSARITIQNKTAAAIWMVDPDGNPDMVLRANNSAAQDSPSVIERGLPAADAQQPISIDLGMLVQDETTAISQADWLWARVSRARWRAQSVRVPAHMRVDLGDLLTLNHAKTGLSANVLVTKVRIEGSSSSAAAEIAKYLDLAILPPTWANFDRAWSGKTYDDYDAVWAGKNGPAFDDNPLRVEA